MYINFKREFRLNRLSIALLAAGLFAQPLIANAAPRTTVTNLGTLGGSTSTAEAINDSGQVVGYSNTNGNTAQHAFLYSNGIMTDLGTLGGTYSSATAINASGQVVGYSNTTNNTAQRAFLYSNGNKTDLGTLGGAYSFAYAINASGQVVGQAYTTGDTQNNAFLYSNGNKTDLGTLGGTGSIATAINASGQVAGNAFTAGNTAKHAFLYSNGNKTDLGTLGGTYSYAAAINASGQVAGAAYTAGDATYHAILYSNGSMTDLGTLGGAYSSASAINDSGQVVGQAYTTAGAPHAFLYSNGSMYDLNSLAPAGVTFYDAAGINRYAQIAINGSNGASILTLHPDWQGGNGNWDDWSNTHWNYSGLGAIGLNPGAPHDVVINPTGSATVMGSADATVRTLTVGGAVGQIVTLNLNNGSTATTNGSTLNANGVLAGSGRLSGGIYTMQNSRVQVNAGESQQYAGGYFITNGEVRMTGNATNRASMETAYPAINNVTGRYNVQNASLSFNGGLSNYGQLNVTFGNSDIYGAVTTLSGGKILLSGNSNTTFYDAIEVQSGGELRVSPGSTAVFFGQVYQRTGSIFSGSGTKFYEGGLSVGNSPGLGVDAGDVSFGAGNEYLAEIGGRTAGTGFDHYTVDGKLTFGGTLKLLSWNSFVAQAGQSFDLFDWGSAEGAFSNIDSTGFLLANGTRLDTSMLYTSGVISVQAVPEADTWAMLLAGLGLMGVVARRRRRA
jgi:probable HAF family extracellular repeat protein